MLDAAPLFLFGASAGLAGAVIVALLLDRAATLPLKGSVVVVLVGGLAFAWVGSPLRATGPDALHLPLRALAALGAAMQWSVVRQLFDGSFTPRRAVGLPIAIWAAGMLAPMLVGATWPTVRPLATLAVAATAVGLVADQAWVLIGCRRDDLAPFRRNLRLVLAAGCGAYVLLAVGFGMTGLRRESMAAAALFIGLQVLFKLFWLALTLGSPSALRRAYEISHEPPPAPAEVQGAPGDRDAALRAQRESVTRAQLERQAQVVREAMEARRLYERPRLTVEQLAAEVRLPEHRVRAAINGAMGYRNFSAFLNHYRLREVARRLRDPAFAHLPIASIALDLGYASLGPFNRAFRAAFAVTPSEYRQARPAPSGAPAGAGTAGPAPSFTTASASGP